MITLRDIRNNNTVDIRKTTAVKNITHKIADGALQFTSTLQKRRLTKATITKQTTNLLL